MPRIKLRAKVRRWLDERSHRCTSEYQGVRV
jgi:hypothetical protein